MALAYGIHIGTSGWHYGHWRGCFYPPDLSPSEWLSCYSRQFTCVELNNSFYKLPTVAAIRAWVEQTPENFLFAVKASRLLTHMKKLRDCGEVLLTFLDTLRAFGDKLGPILFQLPPHWHANPKRLKEFLQILPRDHRFAFEFRDPSWHTPEIYDLLCVYDAAFCQFDLGGFQSPGEVTADFVYVRLHGPDTAYAGSYSVEMLKVWAHKLLTWQAGGKAVFLFFDNDQFGYAVDNARTLKQFCGECAR